MVKATLWRKTLNTFQTRRRQGRRLSMLLSVYCFRMWKPAWLSAPVMAGNKAVLTVLVLALTWAHQCFCERTSAPMNAPVLPGLSCCSRVLCCMELLGYGKQKSPHQTHFVWEKCFLLDKRFSLLSLSFFFFFFFKFTVIYLLLYAIQADRALCVMSYVFYLISLEIVYGDNKTKGNAADAKIRFCTLVNLGE